jgi:hypothetical protein
VWVDPMLEELAASLVLTAGAPAVGCPPPPLVTSWGVEASLVDTHSPVKGAQWTTDSPTLSQPTQRVADLPPVSPQQGRTQASASTGNERGLPTWLRSS